MPIEVRELVIKARVEDYPQGTTTGNNGTPHRPGSLSEWELQNVIALCTEEVMKIIKKQNQR